MNTGEESAGRRSLRPYEQLPVRPWFLAPPQRVAADLPAETLTLHTIQARDAYATLVEDGVLLGEPWRGEPEFQEAYSWMMRQMDGRIDPGPPGRMLWLYASSIRWVLRRHARGARGDVLMTVRIPRHRALVSDFSDWHAVLNRFLHVPPEPNESEDAWEQRWTARDEDFSARAEPYESRPLAQWPTELRRELERSWEALFDPATWVMDRTLQATIRDLHAEDVTRAVRIR